jgi:hypothetical protein
MLRGKYVNWRSR